MNERMAIIVIWLQAGPNEEPPFLCKYFIFLNLSLEGVGSGELIKGY